MRQWATLALLATTLVLAACAASGHRSAFDAGPSADGSASARSDGPDAGVASLGPEAGKLSGGGFDATMTRDTGPHGDGSTALAIAPLNPTVTVTIVNTTVTTPSITFTATQGGAKVTAGWSVDQGAIASITPGGIFTPTGQSGGAVVVTAGVGAQTVSTTVTVILNRTQNGFTGPIVLTGSGGYGGVGGEGPGGPVSAANMTTLQGTPTADPTRTFLYPYTGTVWPRGLLAPLLQWSPGMADATAIRIELASMTYSYDGYFGRPAALPATSLYVRAPIPQDVWQQATESTAGSDTLALTVVLLQSGAAVGPLTESWTVAPGILQGTVYYNSYGTLLVQNSDFTVNGALVGAAILGIDPGALAPKVIAGVNTPAGASPGTGCRACHTVAANGASLIVQDNVYPYNTTSDYALGTLTETVLTPPYAGALNFAGLSPDGTYALTSGVSMGSPTDSQTELYKLAPPAANPVTVAGLPAGVIGGTPAFSPDGKHVAFTFQSGTIGSLTGDGTHIVTMGFDETGPSLGGAANVFSLTSTDAGSSLCVGFPSFMPTNDSLLVQLQLASCGSATFSPYVGTGNVQSEIWWTDLATATQTRLNAMNGRNPDGSSYLPTGPNNHDSDETLNYEPTVNPAPSGGYAWVIFTSRRLYGSIATIDPFYSDPRNGAYDYLTQVTPKKLWVAAIDLNATPGTDPSHPAFYLPAQELQAGNARGFWVLSPCLANGKSCTEGDQCCDGYCQPLGADGGLVCGSAIVSTDASVPMCAGLGDKCTTSANCCDNQDECIDGFCEEPGPPK